MTSMKCVFLFITFVAASNLVNGEEEKYTTKWDHINVKEILESDRLLNNYYKCLMDEGSCSPEGSELKRNLPDALLTDCKKCSEKQKENTDIIINYLIDKKKAMWEKLEAKYDPDRAYFNRHYKDKEV